MMFEIGKNYPGWRLKTPSAGVGWPRIARIFTKMERALRNVGLLAKLQMAAVVPAFRFTYAALRCRCNPAAIYQLINNETKERQLLAITSSKLLSF